MNNCVSMLCGLDALESITLPADHIRRKKHNFNVTCPGVHLVEIASRPPDHEKLCFDVSCPDARGMHYMSRRCNRMQEHKIGVTCPGGLFVKTATGPAEHEK
jgi:hypothetical protein